MSTIRVVNIQHSDATEPNIVLNADGTATFVSGITISGGTNLTVSGTAEFASGTVSAPGITFIDDNNTGIYEPAADTVAITTAATERLRVDNSGNVIVGTSSTVNPTLRILGSSAHNSFIQFADGDSNNVGQLQYSHSSNALITAVNGSERMRIDSSGNVGIGKVSSGNKLEIEGQGNTKVVIDGRTDAANGSDAILELWSKNSGGTNNFGFVDFDGDNNFEIGIGGSGAASVPLVFKTNGSERMRIDSSGNVGVGTSSPLAQLHCTEDIRFGNAITLSRSISTGLVTITDATAEPYTQGFAFRTNETDEAYRFQNGDGTSTYFTIRGSGNVGIGTTNPISILTTSVNTPDGLGLYMENRADAGTNDKIGLAFVLRRSGGYAFNQTRIRAIKENAWTGTPSTINSALTFSTYDSENAAERMRIDSSGRLLLGTSSGQGKFIVQGSLPKIQSNYNGTKHVELGIGNSGCGFAMTTGLFMSFNHQPYADRGTDNNLTERMRINSDGVVRTSRGLVVGSITNTIVSSDALIISGNVIGSGSGTYALKWNSSNGIVTYDTSSRLVKENIVDCPYGLETLKQLHPRKYFRTDDQQDEIGFVADELAEVMPEFVPFGPKRIITKNDEDTEEIALGVNYEKLTAVLTKALQEAIAKIEDLETRIATLENT